MYVRIYDDALGFAKPCPEYDVCGFARGSGDGDQLGERLGDLASEVVDDGLRRSDNSFCFVAIETGGTDVGLEFFRLERSEMFRRGIFLEDGGSDFVHAHVSGLCGEDG